MLGLILNVWTSSRSSPRFAALPLKTAAARQGAPRRAVGVAVAPRRVDDLEALAPARQELGDELGRVLEISIHDADDIAWCVADAIDDGGRQAALVFTDDDFDRVLAGQ